MGRDFSEDYSYSNNSVGKVQNNQLTLNGSEQFEFNEDPQDFTFDNIKEKAQRLKRGGGTELAVG
jgi:hypothetical protein